MNTIMKSSFINPVVRSNILIRNVTKLDVANAVFLSETCINDTKAITNTDNKIIFPNQLEVTSLATWNTESKDPPVVKFVKLYAI